MRTLDRDYVHSLAIIRTICFQGAPERQWHVLRRSLEAFFAALPAAEPADADEAAARSGLAVTLLSMAEINPAPELTGLCLASLLRLGQFGAVLAMRLLERRAAAGTGLDPLFALLEEQGPEAALGLLHRYFLAPRDKESPVYGKVRALLKQATGTPSMTAKEFLGSLFPEPVAFALGDRLLAGDFGKAAMKVLARPHASRNEEDTARLAQALSILDEPRLAEPLAGALRSGLPAPALTALLDALGRAVHAPDDGAIEAAAGLLSHPDRAVRLAALEALARLHAPGLGGRVAGMIAARPEDRDGLILRLPLLEYEEAAAVLDGLDAPDRERASRLLFGLLARLAPDRLARAADRLGSDGTAPEIRAALLAALPPRPKPAGPGDPRPPVVSATGQVWNGARRGNADILSLVCPCSGTNKASAPDDGEIGGWLKGETVRGSALSGRRIVQAVFEDVVFERTGLADVLLKNVRFVRCVFRGARLRRAEARGVVFEACVFERADLTGMRWRDVRLLECRFQGCAVAGSDFASFTGEDTAFVDSTFAACTLTGCELACVLFRACDFTRAEMSASRLLGVDVVDCDLEGATLDGCVVEGADLRGTTARGCRVAGTRTDEPHLAEAARETFLGGLRSIEEQAPGLAHCAPEVGPECAAAMEAAVRLALRELDAERRRDAFLADEARRMEWTERRLGPERTEFLRILPLLLSSGAFAAWAGRSRSPACRVHGYHPGYLAMEAFRRRFPGAPRPVAREDAVVVEAVYSIGSTGTVAMTRESDLDCWVVASLDDAAGKAEALARALARLEEWAGREYGLEAHFFLMEPGAVRRNNFGFSDQESSGTAQALILKEEFYRTALRCAGKKPVWWLVPPGAPGEAYDRVTARADRAEYLDLGAAAAIPQDEFFGASLWQIVKALGSPFKSILKFGILEKYTRDGGTGLLCERRKAALLAGSGGLWSVDPYALMVRESIGFHQDTGNEPAVRLLKLAFALKAELARLAPGLELPELPEEKALDAALAGIEGPFAFGGLDAARRLSFPDRVRLGSLINRFVIDTYLRVRERLDATREARISPADLTRLGRRIQAAFARRPDKIERIPFLPADERFFRVLRVSADRCAGRIAWKIQGCQPNASTGRFDLADLRHGHDLPALLAWLVANAVYAPGVEVRADYSVNPATTSDLQGILQTLYDFFPPGAAFHADIEEGLRDERVKKAFVILNLTVPRDRETVEEASVVYANNWGELFCRTVRVGGRRVVDDPYSFLEEALPQECPPGTPVEIFVPDRARCLAGNAEKQQKGKKRGE